MVRASFGAPRYTALSLFLSISLSNSVQVLTNFAKCGVTNLGRCEQHKRGALEHVPGGGDLRSPPLVAQVRTALRGQPR